MSNSSKVRLAVIGVGVMGSSHLRDISSLPNTELAAIVDIDRARADTYGKQYQVPVFYDHRELLERGGIDGVIIATPHYDHTSIAIDFMNKGVHVMTEKPIAVHT